VRLAVPKAYVVLAGGYEPTRELAARIFRFARDAPRAVQAHPPLEFADLPKTISGKIRRVELRTGEQDRSARSGHEYTEDDFPELRSRS
jgi:acetyl-CoA synthetase